MKMTATSTICSSIKFVLRILGIWPDVSCSVLRRLFWFTTLIFAQICQYAYIALHYRIDELMDLMDSLSSLQGSSNCSNLSSVYSRLQPYDYQFTSRQFEILHVSGQIDILREWLTKVFSKYSADSMDEITMRSLIMKHQHIITFAENIETLYTFIALIMLLSDTIITCCLGFVIVTSLKEPNAVTILIKCVLYYISVNLEAFIYCFIGEYISSKSKMIGSAAYDSLWYNFPTKENRPILFLIVRSQKKLTITSGKIVDLSLERFTSVMKASVSYMSVLLAMN